MKKFTLSALALAAVATTAQAKEEIAEASSPLRPFASYNAGYLIDNEEMLHTIRLGVEHVSTQYFIQLGYFDAEKSFNEAGYGAVDGSLELGSVSAGVIGRKQLARNFVGYVGGSIGAGKVDLEYNFKNFGQSVSDNDTSLYLDVVTGFEFLVSNNVSFTTGLHYIFSDSVEIFGLDTGNTDDIAIEAGITVRF